MKKIISTIVVMGLISTVLANPAFADNRHGGGINPLWIPVAIISTLAAVITIAQPQPVVYEQRVYPEPRRTVIYEEPRRYRHGRDYERRVVTCNHDEREHAYESPRYRDYR